MQSMLDHPSTQGALGSHYRADGVNDSRGIYVMARAKLLDRAATEEPDRDGSSTFRCDATFYGPYGFHEWDDAGQVCSCGSTDRPSPATGSHSAWIRDLDYIGSVLDVLPFGYVVYFEMEAGAEEAWTQQFDPVVTRTLQEMLRLIWEWSEAYETFENRSPVAETGYNIWNELAPPPQVASWVQQQVPEQAVARFLRGNPNAKERAAGTPPPSPQVDDWLTALMTRENALGRVRG